MFKVNLKKNGTDVEESERQAGGSQKSNINEQVAANTELEQSGSK